MGSRPTSSASRSTRSTSATSSVATVRSLSSFTARSRLRRTRRRRGVCRGGQAGPGTRRATPRTARRAPRARFGVSTSVDDDVCAARRQLGGQLVLAPERVADPLLLPADQLVAQHGRLEPVGRELDPCRSGAPRPFAARAALGLLDEPPLREGAQVVAARRRAVADRRAAFGRCRMVDGVQVVEQREPGRMRESAHRSRVGQGEGAVERDLSKLLFREPGCQARAVPSRVRDRPVGRPAHRPTAPRRACRGPSRRAGASRARRRTLPPASIESIPRYSASCSQSGSSIHSATSFAARKSPSTQTSSASEPATVDARREHRGPGRRVVDGVVRSRRAALGRRARSTRRDRVRRSPAPRRRAAQARAPGRRAAMRSGQYVNRPVGSHGPTIRPGRGMNAPGKRSRTTSSQSAFNSP